MEQMITLGTPHSASAIRLLLLGAGELGKELVIGNCSHTPLIFPPSALKVLQTKA